MCQLQLEGHSILPDLANLVTRRLPHPANFNPDDASDISPIRYEQKPLSPMAKQRKGILCAILTAESRVDRARQAPKLKFLLPQEIPMPMNYQMRSILFERRLKKTF